MPNNLCVTRPNLLICVINQEKMRGPLISEAEAGSAQPQQDQSSTNSWRSARPLFEPQPT
ncbi:MAG: hypothetical protein C5B50_02830 [Verrucomicrobia bacterium]|nr:MAG: hypothetical protein C5B50_02830 [Verrucomicrobiota bacterium]